MRRNIDLTEGQWAEVKAQAARRRQTISQFLGDVVDELLPSGHVRPATKEVGPPVDLTFSSMSKTTGKFPKSDHFPISPEEEKVVGRPSDYDFSTQFRPVPKPGRKK